MISQRGSNVSGSFGSEACEQAIAKAGQHLRGVPLADLAGVFTERHVADVVRTVLDAPVPSVPTQQGRGIRQATRHAGDPVRHLVLLFASASAPTLDATDLSHARPIKMLGQTRRGFQTPAFAAAVSFVGSFCFRQMGATLLLGVGGKRPAENRLQSTSSNRADFL